MHILHSTLAMRSAGGLKVIKKAVEQLSKYHDRHIRLYDPTLVSLVVLLPASCHYLQYRYHHTHIRTCTHIHTYTHTHTITLLFI